MTDEVTNLFVMSKLVDGGSVKRDLRASDIVVLDEDKCTYSPFQPSNFLDFQPKAKYGVIEGDTIKFIRILKMAENKEDLSYGRAIIPKRWSNGPTSAPLKNFKMVEEGAAAKMASVYKSSKFRKEHNASGGADAERKRKYKKARKSSGNDAFEGSTKEGKKDEKIEEQTRNDKSSEKQAIRVQNTKTNDAYNQQISKKVNEKEATKNKNSDKNTDQDKKRNKDKTRPTSNENDQRTKISQNDTSNGGATQGKTEKKNDNVRDKDGSRDDNDKKAVTIIESIQNNCGNDDDFQIFSDESDTEFKDELELQCLSCATKDDELKSACEEINRLKERVKELEEARGGDISNKKMLECLEAKLEEANRRYTQSREFLAKEKLLVKLSHKDEKIVVSDSEVYCGDGIVVAKEDLYDAARGTTFGRRVARILDCFYPNSVHQHFLSGSCGRAPPGLPIHQIKESHLKAMKKVLKLMPGWDTIPKCPQINTSEISKSVKYYTSQCLTKFLNKNNKTSAGKKRRRRMSSGSSSDAEQDSTSKKSSVGKSSSSSKEDDGDISPPSKKDRSASSSSEDESSDKES